MKALVYIFTPGPYKEIHINVCVVFRSKSVVYNPELGAYLSIYISVFFMLFSNVQINMVTIVKAYVLLVALHNWFVFGTAIKNIQHD